MVVGAICSDITPPPTIITGCTPTISHSFHAFHFTAEVVDAVFVVLEGGTDSVDHFGLGKV